MVVALAAVVTMLLYRYIIQRAIIGVILMWLGLALFVLALQLFAQNTVIDDRYTWLAALTYTVSISPSIAMDIFPIACFIGTITAMGTMANNSEMVIMRSNGMSLARIVAVFLLPILLLSAVLMYLNESVFIHTTREAEIQRSLLRYGSAHPDQGQRNVWLKERDKIMHIFQVVAEDDIRLVNAWFFNEGEFELKQFIHGDTARHTGSSLAIDTPTQLNYGDTWTLSDSGLSLDFPIVTAYPVILWQATDNPDYLTSAQLRQFIAYLKEQNTPSEAYAYFLYKRLLLPITVVALVVLAVAFISGPLRSTPIGTRIFSGLMFGLLFRFVQQMLGSVSTVFAMDALLLSVVPIGLCLLVGVIGMHRAR